MQGRRGRGKPWKPRRSRRPRGSGDGHRLCGEIESWPFCRAFRLCRETHPIIIDEPGAGGTERTGGALLRQAPACKPIVVERQGSNQTAGAGTRESVLASRRVLWPCLHKAKFEIGSG